MKKVKFINSYSFIFSPRPGTPASEMKLVDNKIAKERLVKFQKLAEEIKIKYKKSLIGKRVKTLIENKSKDKINYYFGRDEYQNPVVVFSKKNIVGCEKNVLIKKISQQTIYGEIDNKDGILAA